MTSLLKPGILVSLKTSITGGVTYERRDLTSEELAAKAAEQPQVDVSEELAAKATEQPQVDVSKWETTRIIENVEEHKAATKVRSAAGAAVRAICTATSFGLLCPETREADLDKAVAAARELADQHNRVASSTKVSVYVLKGRIASSDEEAARAIASEVSELLQQMEAGIRAVDVEAVREAAAKAKKMGAVLDEEQGKKINEAVEQARLAAREIVRRVEKGGEDAGTVLGELETGAIQGARFSFLDMQEGTAPAEAVPAVQLQRMAELDVPEPAKLDDKALWDPETGTGVLPPIDVIDPSFKAVREANDRLSQLDLELDRQEAVELAEKSRWDEPQGDSDDADGSIEDTLRRAGAGLPCYELDLEV